VTSRDIAVVRRSITLILALAIPALAGQKPDPAARLKPGPLPKAQPPYQLVQFSERSPLSSVEAQCKLMRIRPEPMDPDYDLENESFFLVAPKGQKLGLFVYISPSSQGTVPGHMLAVLAKHKLIYVSPNHAGNPRSVLHRMGLALDAVHNLRKRFYLDPDRIYIGGISGGGRTASMLGLLYPRVFTGAFPMIGVNYSRPIQVPGEAKGRMWASAIPPLNASHFNYLKQNSRFVLLTGEKDFNRVETKAKFEEGFQKDGFRHVHYLEVPGMGHQAPPQEWFEKGIALLNEPLVEQRKPPTPLQREEKARGKLWLARNYIAARRADRAKAVLQKLIDEYPDTPQAAEAKKLLEELAR